jgi:hypothetical protein
VVGSKEWQDEQEASDRKEQRLKETINNICRGC